jgi:hemoglobin
VGYSLAQSLESAQCFPERKNCMQRWVSGVFVAFVLAGFSSAEAGDRHESLYERLGGRPAIQAVANSLVDRILVDDRVNKWFAHAAASPENADAYKAKLADFICVGVGGPCKYTGLDMIAAHKGRGVTSEAFRAVVQDLIAVLDQMKVPEKEKSEVLKIIGSLKPAIVQSGTAQN